MEDKLFRLIVVLPEGISYEGNAERVELNTSEGQIGVLKGHIPLTSIIKPGILKITETSGTKEVRLSGGIVEIFSEKVMILATESL